MRRIGVTIGVVSVLALLPVAHTAASAPQTVTVDVVMVDYKFIPDHLTFEHDVHYRLHLENHGSETHEFTAPAFFATAKIDNPDVLENDRSEVLLGPGEKKDVLFTPLKPGTYDLRCADHDWAGMVGSITVK